MSNDLPPDNILEFPEFDLKMNYPVLAALVQCLKVAEDAGHEKANTVLHALYAMDTSRLGSMYIKLDQATKAFNNLRSVAPEMSTDEADRRSMMAMYTNEMCPEDEILEFALNRVMNKMEAHNAPA